MSRLRRLLAVLVWLAVWQALAAFVGNNLILAGPVETLRALASLVVQGEFWAKVVWSFARIALGFACGFVLALLLGGLAARFEHIEDLFHPLMLAIKSTPVVCIVVLLLIWFGSRIVSAISVFLVALPAIYFSALEAVRALDVATEEMLAVYKVPRLRRLLAFVWPSMQPFLLASCEMVVGMSWKAGVAAELIGTPAGSIGERIYQAKILFETADLFAWTIVVVLMAWLCERAFLALLRASAAWSMRAAVPKGRASESPTAIVPKPIKLESLSFNFDGEQVFEDVNYHFEAGSKTCLRDPSGSGKTTLLRILAGILEPNSGRTQRAQCSLAFQDVTLIEGMNAQDNVALVAGETLSEDQIRNLLLEVLPTDALTGTVSELSGGQRRRVELARALAYPSEVVLLDEPFVSLDEDTYKTCARFVTEHLNGRTLIVATHNEHDAALLGAQEVHLFS